MTKAFKLLEKLEKAHKAGNKKLTDTLLYKFTKELAKEINPNNKDMQVTEGLRRGKNNIYELYNYLINTYRPVSGTR